LITILYSTVLRAELSSFYVKIFLDNTPYVHICVLRRQVVDTTKLHNIVELSNVNTNIGWLVDGQEASDIGKFETPLDSAQLDTPTYGHS